MPLLDADLDPQSARAAFDAADLLANLGHDVEQVEPPWHQPALLELFTAAFGPGICTQIAFAALLAGREVEQPDVEPLSWELWKRSKAIDSVGAQIAAVRLQAFARAIVTWSDPYDAILTPALAQPPVPIGELDPCGPDPWGTFARSGQFTPFTAIANVTGSPAISLPLYERSGEPALPLAVQLIGRPAREGQLLALAAELEAAQPWLARRAPVTTAA
jgi:amidase